MNLRRRSAVSRVVITGLGVVAPGGIGKDAFWDSMINARRQTGLITAFDTSEFLSKVAAEVKGFNPAVFGISHEEAAGMDRYVQFALAGAKLAVEDSGLELKEMNRERCGVALANAICGTKWMEEEFLRVTRNGHDAIDPALASPYLYDASIFNSPANFIAARYGLKGGACVLSTGCTAGTDSVAFACENIQLGLCDVMITGASEAPLTPIALAAFDVIKALSKHNDEPEAASRPFDRTRNGFVLAEGAGILVLEEYDHAVRRGARIYAEIAGFGSTSNAYHMTDLPKDGDALARSIRLAMDEARVDAADVDYISSHGSSTEQNDIFETNAIKSALGENAYRVPVSSIKSMIGHPLSAANSIELALSALVIERGVIPPTANYRERDPECDLDYVPNEARDKKVDVLIKTSSGFSGIHSSMILRRT
ncbi:MAG: beta-ketoacyl-[acyl-carrier-protein] synthase family protein [Nitrospirota bacterium]